LITTLLLLMLLSGLTLAMAWSARSDMLINGYYRNFRGSFYAADSGINIVRQSINPLFQAGGALYPSSFAVGTNPLPYPQTENAVLTALGNPKSGTIAGSGATGSSASSWPGKYTATLTFAQQSCSTDVSSNCPTPFPTNAKIVNYSYAYTITSVGTSMGNEKTTLFDSGLVNITGVIPTPGKLTFAGYGMFINNYPLCGNNLVAGTITGPVFTNGSWNFGTGTYAFTDTVQQVNPNVGTGASCPSGSSSLPANVSAPQGFQAKQTAIPMPTDSFNQQSAVLDGKGANADGTPRPQPTQSAMNAALKNISKTPYPASGAVPAGVYLPYSTDASGNNPTFTGGGIMVSGDATVVLTPGSGKAQTYTITTSSGTTTVTIDPTANTTTMAASGKPTLTISGVPHQVDPSTNANLGYDTMLYVDGNITSLKGPGEGVPAIQDATALTITASKDVTITGDILYNKEPVYGTPTTPVSASHPIDTLVGGNDTKQALGIFTATGNINMDNKQASTNLEIDASLAMTGGALASSKGGLTNTGAAIGTLTIVGGRIQNNIYNINSTQRNVLFDARYKNGAFSPPWFPSTGITLGTNDAVLNQPVMTRLQWVNRNNYF